MVDERDYIWRTNRHVAPRIERTESWDSDPVSYDDAGTDVRFEQWHTAGDTASTSHHTMLGLSVFTVEEEHIDYGETERRIQMHKRKLDGMRPVSTFKTAPLSKLGSNRSRR